MKERGLVERWTELSICIALLLGLVGILAALTGATQVAVGALIVYCVYSLTHLYWRYRLGNQLYWELVWWCSDKRCNTEQQEGVATYAVMLWLATAPGAILTAWLSPRPKRS